MDRSTGAINKSHLNFLFHFRSRLFHCCFCILVVESYQRWLLIVISKVHACVGTKLQYWLVPEVDEVAGTNNVFWERTLWCKGLDSVTSEKTSLKSTFRGRTTTGQWCRTITSIYLQSNRSFTTLPMHSSLWLLNYRWNFGAYYGQLYYGGWQISVYNFLGTLAFTTILRILLNPIWHRLFWTVSQSWGSHHNFVVIAPMIIKFGTGIKLDVFYTMVTKRLWHHYYYVVAMS